MWDSKVLHTTPEVTMKIAETRKNLKEILNANLALKKHFACFNGDLVFSNGFLPKECGIALGCQQGSQLGCEPKLRY